MTRQPYAPTYTEIRRISVLLTGKMPVDAALSQAAKRGRRYTITQWTESLVEAAKADPALAWLAVAVGVA